MNIPVKNYKEYFNREGKVPYFEFNTKTNIKFYSVIQIYPLPHLLKRFIPLETK